MRISCLRAVEVVAAGVLTLLLVATTAVPATAGPPGPVGPAGSGTSEGKRAGARPDGDHARPTPKQATRGPEAKTRKGQGAGPTAPARPPAGKGSEQAKGKPPVGDDGAPAPHDAPGDAGPPETSPADHTPPEVRAGSRVGAEPVTAPTRQPLRSQGTVRPAAAETSSTPPSVTFLAAPAPEPIETTAAAPAPTPTPVQAWPTLPGAAGHPAFPGLLAAALLGLVALGFRGDRRDPKLRLAAIDDRDDRAPFREPKR